MVHTLLLLVRSVKTSERYTLCEMLRRWCVILGCYSGICMFDFIFSKMSDRVMGAFGRDRSTTLRFFLITFFGIMTLAVVILPLLLRVDDGTQKIGRGKE